MVLRSLHLKNFQIHKDSKLTFSPKINVITGNSDEGKSSIIRALYWILFNSPSGNEFISWDKPKECSVQLETDKAKIIRKKSKKGVNKYILEQGDSSNTFNAIRTDVPKEINDVLNLSMTNIQMQDDPYFLLNNTSSETARKLNDVVGSHTIDSSMKYVRGKIQKDKAEKNKLKKEVEEYKTEKKKYKRLAEAEKLYDSLTYSNNRCDDVQHQLDDLTDIIDILPAKARIDALELSLKKAQSIFNKLQVQITKEKENTDKLTQIGNDISKITKINTIINNREGRIKTITQYVKQLEKQRNTYDEQMNTINQIIECIDTSQSIQRSIVQLEKQHKQAQNTFQEFKIKIKACPTCERPFK